MKIPNLLKKQCVIDWAITLVIIGFLFLLVLLKELLDKL